MTGSKVLTSLVPPENPLDSSAADGAARCFSAGYVHHSKCTSG